MNRKISLGIILFSILIVYAGCGPEKLDDGIDTELQFAGITWDGTYFWGIDRVSNDIVKFDPESKSIVKTYHVNHECLNGITAFDGFFWISTCTGKILKVSDTGNIEQVIIPQNYDVSNSDFTGITAYNYKFFIMDHHNLVEFDSDFYYVQEFELPKRQYGDLSYKGKDLVIVCRSGVLLYINPEDGSIIEEEKVAHKGKIYGVANDGEDLWFSVPRANKIVRKIKE